MIWITLLILIPKPRILREDQQKSTTINNFEAMEMEVEMEPKCEENALATDPINNKTLIRKPQPLEQLNNNLIEPTQRVSTNEKIELVIDAIGNLSLNY